MINSSAQSSFMKIRSLCGMTFLFIEPISNLAITLYFLGKAIS